MVINTLNQTPADIRRHHRAVILNDVQANPGISRSEIARRIGLSDMAATRIVRELLEAKVLQETLSVRTEVAKDKSQPIAKPKSVGRPKIGLKMRQDSVFGAGMTFSAYHSEVSLSDGDGQIIGRRSVKNVPFENPLECAKLFSDELNQLITESGIPKSRICGVGVVLSAKVDPETGAIIHSDYFGWAEDEAAFCSLVRNELGLAVTIRNIADAIAIAETCYGVAKNVRNLALIHTATLTGASIMSDGEVMLGHQGFAGRVGHLRHEETNFECVCGRNDCLNLSASGFAILKKLGLHNDTKFKAQNIGQYADLLMKIVRNKSSDDLIEAAQSLSALLDMLTVTLNPEMVVLSGHIGAQPAYVQGAAQAMQDRRASNTCPIPVIVAGQINAIQAAPMLALSDLCFSELFDFDSFLATAHLVGEA